MDSGATAHICNDRHMFSSLQNVDPFSISIGDKSEIKAIGRGSIDVLLSVSGKPQKCILNNVVYAPAMAYNMLSVRIMSRSGKRTVFKEHSCHVEKDGKVIVEGSVVNNLYCLKTYNPDKHGDESHSAMVADINLWHQ